MANSYASHCLARTLVHYLKHKPAGCVLTTTLHEGASGLLSDHTLMFAHMFAVLGMQWRRGAAEGSQTQGSWKSNNKVTPEHL